MNKPYGRQTKKKVGRILSETVRHQAMEQLAQIPDEQLTSHLFSYFYNKEELIKFRSISAMGLLAARISKSHMERARIIMRRIMWNLNDESGGIGWGSAEAMGEILNQSPELAIEYKSILFSYLDSEANFIEHEMLQRGVLWGIGTYLESSPNDITQKTKDLLFSHLHSDDPIKRGYAIRALIHADCFDCNLVPENIKTDHTVIQIFDNWNFKDIRICDMALACKPHE